MDVSPNHSRPEETKGRIRELDKFFGERMLSYVTGETCRAYVAQRSTDAAARRELEDLRAAINYHRRENLHDKIVSVVLPHERVPRDPLADGDRKRPACYERHGAIAKCKKDT